MADKTNIIQSALDQVGSDVAFINALRQARTEAGLSHEDVAAKIGWLPNQVSDIEDLRHDPTLGELRRLALALGLRVTHGVERKS